MKEKLAVVVTSISKPNDVLEALADGCRKRGHQFIVVGDRASPPDFQLAGCEFYGLDEQRETGFKFAQLCPEKHYARKNIGYLLAIRDGATILAETDDDNIPYEEFWAERKRAQRAQVIQKSGWVNVYRYFSDKNIWPRGLPLDQVLADLPAFEALKPEEKTCPIQQGLADDNPDVDAIYRLVMPLPQFFRKDRSVILAEGAWCPFNSQNTTWWPEAFALLYLPAYCSFRMTDIWRSFVAQRVAWEYKWPILFHAPTVWQKRNDHNLMRDFKDEVPGYLNNSALCEALMGLKLSNEQSRIGENLRLCYEKLVSLGLVDGKELELVDAWLSDLRLASR
ncbi:MAG: STELLO glycosyltransferase family protein [Bdellovibrionota bacterium]